MCSKCGNLLHSEVLEAPDRRKVLLGAASLAAIPALSAVAGQASAAPAKGAAAEQAAYKTRAWGVTGKGAPFTAMQIQRRALRPTDVKIDILYASICHSDIHTVQGDWGPANAYPVVPGHEMVGRVVAVGGNVTKFKVGDIAGVGCMVDSCGTCDNCLADREQNCLNGATFTYDNPDKVSGGSTYGGYSKSIVVTEHFVLRIPPGANLPGMAPILCAGITTFSPQQHWKLQHGQRAGVIGLGGLGHMALKLAVARGAEVTVFTTTPAKVADARRMGAKEAVLWSDAEAMKRLANHFDYMISTVPESYPFQQFMDLLKLDATLVNVGALGEITGLNGMKNIFGRKNFAGSLVGGVAETQEVIDYCAARNIAAEVEMIRPDQIQEAYRRIIGKDVRYRFVIDMTAA